MTHPLAGKPAPRELLIDVERLRRLYYEEKPDPADPQQRVAFGTSGHRGTALTRAFNEPHILAVTQAVCEYRKAQGTSGPLYLGKDTHALSDPAQDTALEVLAANDVHVLWSRRATPTPVISHAILTYNRGLSRGFADGIVITPSHNPPEDGGIKYNPPSGGPADTSATGWIERRANELLAGQVRRADAARAPTLREHDFVAPYVKDLRSVVDLEAVRAARPRLAVDPLGGSNVAYWKPIVEEYGLDLTVVNDRVDPTFSFMPLDYDGKIRMDCSSPYAMANLVALKDRYDLAFGNDTDSDRDGILLDLLAAEMLARTGKDPGEQARAIMQRLGTPHYTRIDAPATPRQKAVLKKLSPDAVRAETLAGQPIRAKLTRAPGNGAEIGGLKVVADDGWFAARPSGTEDVFKIYAESFRGEDHLQAIVVEARQIVADALRGA